MILPASVLRSTGYAETFTNPKELPDDYLRTLDPDTVVIQHQHTAQQFETLKRQRKVLRNARWVYEIDDVFWELPADSAHREGLPSDIKTQIVRVANACDTIVVTTPKLAEIMGAATSVKDIRILPNQVPKKFLDIVRTVRREQKLSESGAKLRVGWAGGIGHTGDLKLVKEIMDKLGNDEVQWVFMGMVPPGIDKEKVEYHEPVPFPSYPAALAALRLDVALAPLEECLFNHCKSDLRVLEYSMAGYLTIASDIDTYAECPVRKVPHISDMWVEEIRAVARLSPEERADEAEKLHDWVRHSRTMEGHILTYARAYLPKDATPFIPAVIAPQSEMFCVGEAVPGMTYYPSVEAGWRATGGADMLYVRPGTQLTAANVTKLVAAMNEGKFASVCALSNDGHFPKVGTFQPLTTDVAEKVDEAASLCGNEANPPSMAAYPSGPCMLFAANALSRFGLPDLKRFGDIELAAVDWAARAIDGDRAHAVVNDTYVCAQTNMRRDEKAASDALSHVVAWHPNFATACNFVSEKDDLAGVRENIDLMFHNLNHKTPITQDQTYEGWIKAYDTIGPAERAAIEADMKTFNEMPKISIIMPTYNPHEMYLRKALESVLKQIYPNWELCVADDASSDIRALSLIRDARMTEEWRDKIKMIRREENGHICNASNSALELATGEWVVFLDHDDELAPHALYELVRLINQKPHLQFIYSDSDKLDMRGNRCDPYFASDFNYELLLGQNYVTHMAAYRLAKVKEIGGFTVGLEGSQDWDLSLRYLEATCGSPPDKTLISHIPHVLYHWRMSENSTAMNLAAKPYATKAGHRAVLQHLTRTKQPAIVASHPLVSIFNMVRFLNAADNVPSVSIIIPTKDNAECLNACLGSLSSRTTYPDYEIIVVNNNSRDKKMLRILHEAPRKLKNLRVINYDKKFNFADMMNTAVKQAKGEFVVFLNDDTEVMEGAWLADMVAAANRPGVGAVGPKLIYPDNTVQQCGIIFDTEQEPLSSALHVFQKLPVNHPGPVGRAQLTAEWLAVTGACLLIRKALYEELGGFNADLFPVDYNDVDLCLRLHSAGYRNLVVPHAVLMHREGYSKRKKELDAASFANVHAAAERLIRMAKEHGFTHDPYINPNLAFSPHLDRVANPGPTYEWDEQKAQERHKILYINGSAEDGIAAYHAGEIAFCAVLDGHYMRFVYPEMEHVRPFDTRSSADDFIALLGKLGINKIVFGGVGEGTLNALGLLSEAAAEGWQVEYRPSSCGRGPTAGAHINEAAWAEAWERAIYQPKQAGMEEAA